MLMCLQIYPEKNIMVVHRGANMHTYQMGKSPCADRHVKQTDWLLRWESRFRKTKIKIIYNHKIVEEEEEEETPQQENLYKHMHIQQPKAFSSY